MQWYKECTVDIEDILIWRRNKEEHNRRLRADLQKFKENNSNLNKDKYLFHKSDIVYKGQRTLGKESDKEKLEAIIYMLPLTDKNDLNVC